MGVLERRKREKEELRSQILEAASQLFVEQGFENVTIRKIAEKIEYSPSTIYLYFKDKTELLLTICQETFEQLTEELRELKRQGLDPLDAIRAGARSYVEFGISHPNHYLITFCLPQNLEGIAPEPEKAHAEGPGMQAFAELRECLERGMQAGVIADADLERLSQNVWMFLHGITSILINARKWKKFPFVEHGALIDSGLELVLRGIQAGRGVGALVSRI